MREFKVITRVNSFLGIDVTCKCTRTHCGLSVVTMEQHRTYCCHRWTLSAFFDPFTLQILGLDTRCRRIETVCSIFEESSKHILNVLIKDYLRDLSLILRLVLVEVALLVPTLSRQTRMVLPSFTTANPSSVVCKMVLLHPMSFDWVLVN